jgi:hypothetical protein
MYDQRLRGTTSWGLQETAPCRPEFASPLTRAMGPAVVATGFEKTDQFGIEMQ